MKTYDGWNSHRTFIISYRHKRDEDNKITAEFNRTMLAEEYRQSLSSSSNYVVDKILDYDDEFDDE